MPAADTQPLPELVSRMTKDHTYELHYKWFKNILLSVFKVSLCNLRYFILYN